MAALSANRPIPNIIAAQPYAGGGYVLDVLVGITEEIYQGSFVTLDTGDQYAAPLAAGEAFYGMSLERVTGGAANGDVTCKIFCAGIIQHALTSVAVADIGQPVFATDDQTLTLTNDGTDTLAGRLVGVPATGTAIVQLNQPRVEHTTVCAITSFTADMSFAGNSTTAADGIKAVATVIDELRKMGLIQGTIAA